MFALVAYFVASYRLSLKRILGILAAGILVIGFVKVWFVAGASSYGRFAGKGFSFSDYGNLFLEIFGKSDAENTFSSGIEQRFDWWSSVLTQWRQTWGTMLFGLGYGMPLIDFKNVLSSIVREPHNELISIFARGGIIAGVVFIWMQALILKRALAVYAYLKNNKQYGGLATALLFILIFTLIHAIGETPFAWAFYVIPYYFSAGVFIHLFAAIPRKSD